VLKLFRRINEWIKERDKEINGCECPKGKRCGAHQGHDYWRACDTRLKLRMERDRQISKKPKDRLIDLIDKQASILEASGKTPKQVRINPECYAQVVKECRDEIERMRKAAARLFKADWQNPFDIAEEAFPVESVYTKTGHLKFLLDDGLPEGFQVE